MLFFVSWQVGAKEGSKWNHNISEVWCVRGHQWSVTGECTCTHIHICMYIRCVIHTDTCAYVYCTHTHTAHTCAQASPHDTHKLMRPSFSPPPVPDLHIPAAAGRQSTDAQQPPQLQLLLRRWSNFSPLSSFSPLSLLSPLPSLSSLSPLSLLFLLLFSMFSKPPT